MKFLFIFLAFFLAKVRPCGYVFTLEVFSNTKPANDGCFHFPHCWGGRHYAGAEFTWGNWAAEDEGSFHRSRGGGVTAWSLTSAEGGLVVSGRRQVAIRGVDDI